MPLDARRPAIQILSRRGFRRWSKTCKDVRSLIAVRARRLVSNNPYDFESPRISLDLRVPVSARHGRADFAQTVQQEVPNERHAKKSDYENRGGFRVILDDLVMLGRLGNCL